MTKRVEAFKLTVPDRDIADLRERLTHPFPMAPAPALQYSIAWMRGLIDYWGEKFGVGGLRKPVSTPSRSVKCVCMTLIYISLE